MFISQVARGVSGAVGPSIIVQLVAVLSIVMVAPGSEARAASPQELSAFGAAMDYWWRNRSICKDKDGDYLSKEFDEQLNDGSWKQCEDGDSILFSGLICSVGEEFGCQTVSRSQDDTGKWWRSPRHKRDRPEETSDDSNESNFSNDHAAGVLLYILQKRDVGAFRSWTNWMLKHRYGGVWPQYCQAGMKCVFKLLDCPMMDRVALALGEANPLCESPIMPGVHLPIGTMEMIDAIERSFKESVAFIRKVPGGNDALRLDPAVKHMDGLIAKLRKALNELEKERLKLNTVIRAVGDIAGIAQRLNAVVNDAGYPRHGVAVAAYILLKYGGIPSLSSLDAARMVADLDPKNAYFEYVARGATDQMLGQMLAGCRSTGDAKKYPRHQWIWERADNDPSNPKMKLMYWDCVFTGKLYKQGSLPGSKLPELPGMQAAYEAQRKAFEGLMNEANELSAALGNFDKDPKKSVEYLIRFPVESGQAMARGAVEGALKGLNVPDDTAKELSGVLVPGVPPVQPPTEVPVKIPDRIPDLTPKPDKGKWYDPGGFLP